MLYMKEHHLKQNFGFKYRIYPNDYQMSIINQTFGCVRLTYNKMLEEYNTTNALSGISPAKYKNQ